MSEHPLSAEIGRHVAALKGLMADEGVDLLLAVCAGAPHQNGWLRYLTGAEMWGGREFLLLASTAAEPLVVMRSTYDAEWLRQQAPAVRVESTLLQSVPPVVRTVEAVLELTGGVGRLGLLNSRFLTPSEHEVIERDLARLERVDLTAAANRIRRRKSGFEVERIRETGEILNQGMALFAELARPGANAAEVAGRVDGFLKGKGCFWGRVKYAFDQRPFTTPAAPERRFAEDDVILFQFVHCGPHGYWFELAKVFSFRPLPAEVARRLEAMGAAIRTAASLAVPGGSYRALSAGVDEVFRQAGFEVVGKHTLDCHSIGTDESEGDFPPADDWAFTEDMVLALHPATLLRGGHGFLLCDNYLVQEGGAVSLSGASSYHQSLAG